MSKIYDDLKTSDPDEPDLTQLVSDLAQSAEIQATELARIRNNVDGQSESPDPRKESFESGQKELLQRITESRESSTNSCRKG